MQNIRTDLAIEMHEMLMEAAEELSGVTLRQEDKGNIHISRVKIESLKAQRQMGKPIGNYITVEFPDVNIAEGEDYEALCRVVAKEIEALLKLKKKSNVLVVGLGNRDITPDALGPKVVSRLMVTRHLLTYIPDQIDEGIRPVCAISPGVLGTTGMETGEVVRGVVDKIRPEAVIVIDALAARSIDRISTTIQICDTGISPGAGVGNQRKALDKSALGVPVIAVGVPTVVDAVTMAQSVFGNDSKTEQINPDGYAMMVTTRDIDTVIKRASSLVALAINLALHPELTKDDILFLNS